MIPRAAGHWAWLLPWLAAAPGAAFAEGAAGDGHCLAGERALFACTLRGSGQVAALCASGDLREGGALAYRAGPPGRVAMAFPDAAAGSAGRFRHAHYSRALTDYTEVSFDRAGHAYALYDYRSQEHGRDRRERGVRVVDPGGAETDLRCGPGAQARLQALEGVLPCDRDNALAMGACGGPPRGGREPAAAD